MAEAIESVGYGKKKTRVHLRLMARQLFGENDFDILMIVDDDDQIILHSSLSLGEP